MKVFSLLAVSALSLCSLHASSWNNVHLPHQFEVPSKNFNTNIYSAEIPTTPLTWEKTDECHTFQPSSIHWKSDEQTGVKGISFKGLVFKAPELKNRGNPKNTFAVFFHDHECYVDGTEYGWVFNEKRLPQGKFYICFQCNLTGKQQWATWPGSPSAFSVLEGDAAAVAEAMESSEVYRYWNVEVTPAGDFILSLVNPSNYETLSVTLRKPSWYPNIYNTTGFITISSKKQEDVTIKPAPVMHVDSVKIFK